MINLALFAFIIAFVWTYFSISKKNQFESIDFMSQEHTALVKGYAILMILFGHIGQYSGVNGIEFPAGVGVSLFLIASGYGIEYSINHNGMKSFWKKRALKLLIPYWTVEICRFIFNMLTSKEVTVYTVLTDFTLIKPIHPFGWYMNYILVCYVIIWISHIIRQGKYLFPIMLCLFAIIFIIYSTILIEPTCFLRPRQMLSFPFGVFIYHNRSKVKKCMTTTRSYAFIIVGTLIYAILHISFIEKLDVVLYNTMALFTCFLVAIGLLWLMMSRYLNNKFIVKTSIVSFEIYLVHGYTISSINSEFSFLRFAIFCLSTIISAIVLNFITNYYKKYFKFKRRLSNG